MTENSLLMFVEWLLQHYVEVLGSISGMVYLYFSIRQIIWLWPLGILTSLLYIFVFYSSKFYAGMGLQFYYFFISIYGWYHWNKTEQDRPVKKSLVLRSSITEIVIFISVSLVLTLVTGHVLDQYTDSPLPYWDAFITSGSVVATWMLAQRYLENWLFWLVIDVVAIGIYMSKGLYPTVILFIVYTSMAYIGYLSWKKESKNN